MRNLNESVPIMRMLVIGAKGMLGQEFMKQLHDTDVVGWGREDLDITNEHEVMEKIVALKPSVIFNCTAYNNVDRAEDEPEVAMKINGEAVGYLARAAAQLGATFVHFSTDYVFSGKRNNGYYEEDIPDSIAVYGQSKALGEQKALEIFRGPASVAQRRPDLPIFNWYIIRTSRLFGPPGTGATSKKSFPEMMLGFARQKGRIEAIDAEIGSPTYVKDLVETTLRMVKDHALSGIYHVTNSGACTWYKYAKAAVECAGVQAEVVPVGPDRFPRKAKRPTDSTLLNTKLPPLRSWQEAFEEFLKSTN